MSRRVERLTSQIERELATILHQKVSDPRLGFVTITRTEVSSDMSFVRIYYAVYGDETDIRETATALDRSGGFIRHQLGQTLGTRLTPELRFQFDTSYQRGMEVIGLINELDLPDDEADETAPEGT
ncbi:MAG TPA: 30S ribosome-binding factor RbfA [Chloroflexota bacterium]|mgnify:CR=1 FL=1|nr:30S ribosome-binding factor RbfA [Chloroflexota bacterium]